MKRPAPELTEMLNLILAPPHALPLETRLDCLNNVRRQDPDVAAQMDRALLHKLDGQHKALLETKALHEKLEHSLAKFQAPPLHPATFLRLIPLREGDRALVQHGNSRHLVMLDEQIDPATLATGRGVFLSRDFNAILALAPKDTLPEGEISFFERRLPRERILVKVRDEEIVAMVVPDLRGEKLEPGDRLIWDRDARIAFEKLQRAEDHHLFLMEQPTDSFDMIGGLDAEILQIQRALSTHLDQPDIADSYGMPRIRAILLEGPPGTGKTMIARSLANWIASRTPGGRPLFMNIKPAALHTPYYAEAERNYREAFRMAREAASRNHGVPAILFFDELDGIGAQRGQSLSRVHDNVLMAFLAELNGLEERGDVIVVAATNRADALDAALVRPGRMGDLVITIPRPNARAAREILSRHVADRAPFAEGSGGRAACIDACISRLYTPNGDNRLATLKFRSGAERSVHAADMINGAILANIARRALTRACYRELDTGCAGVRMEDFSAALEAEFDAAARLLTPANCRHHLSGLPQDMDVVKVEPVRRHGPMQRHLKVA